MTPEALRRRMAHGNIYPPEQIDIALGHYFRIGNLGALRELALLWVADRVDDELGSYRERHGIQERWETRERIVVALSGAPGSEHLLRRAARLAARIHGEVIGVHVGAGDGRARPLSVGLESQRRLLRELSGRYAEVTGGDVALALVRFARAENASQLILGATNRSWTHQLLHGSVINGVVRHAGPIDVHVISAPETAQPGLPRAVARHHLASVPARRRNIGLLLGTIGIALFAGALAPLRSSLGLPGGLLFLLLGVVLVATLGGVVPAVAAAVVASVGADYFFASPRHSLRLARPSDAVALVVFFAVAAIVSALVDQRTRRGLQVGRAAVEAEALARLAAGSVLSEVEPLPEIVGELRRTFDLDSVAILTAGPEGWRAAATAGSPVPVTPDDATFSVELGPGTVLVFSGRALSADDSRLLAAFVAQLRMAQEHLRLQSEAASAAGLAEANSLRGALLAAVSHDLRTPLASIKAAVTSLLAKDVDWGPQEVHGFSETIDAETDRLTGLIDDLLDMSRLQNGLLPVSLSSTSVEEVVFRAVASLGHGGAGVAIEVTEALPAVQADAGLLERAVANVVANALKWSPPGLDVRVEVGRAGDHVEVRVADRGPGIPEEHRDTVVQPFQRLGDSTAGGPNGIGLGLAVAKGFTEAIGGQLAIEDTPGGGTTVVFSLQTDSRC
jgi:two-component system, OmpR family, sensor histidine kinase KdpD